MANEKVVTIHSSLIRYGNVFEERFEEKMTLEQFKERVSCTDVVYDYDWSEGFICEEINKDK